MSASGSPEDFEEIRRAAALERLELEWERDRATFGLRGLDGTYHAPQSRGFLIAFAIVWFSGVGFITLTAAAASAPLLFLVGPLLLLGGGAFVFRLLWRRIDAYEKAHERYLAGRKELLGRDTRE